MSQFIAAYLVLLLPPSINSLVYLGWVKQVRYLAKLTVTTQTVFTELPNPNAVNPLAVIYPPPDLIIQDELHLISGPLGTMVGLYETAIDALCSREVNGNKVRPKIIASTATVRRATKQIQALFGRNEVDIFPPPGCDRRDSFFAKTVPASEKNARTYVGIAAQGRSLKIVLLRTFLVLMESSFANKDKVDVVLATNMISVGLDITRLGLMVVLGQPKTAAEYIQATSRVGRDEERPGLVVA